MIEIFAMKNRSAFFLTFLLTFWTSVTQAGPIDGWGLFLDVGQLKPVNDDSGREYQDSKIIGDQIDYQFALGIFFLSHFSLQKTRTKGHCRQTQNMGITKPAS